MSSKIFTSVALLVFIIGLSGCATSRKQNDLEAQGLKNQISVMETQLQTKDEEIAALKESLSKTSEPQTISEKTDTAEDAHKKVISNVNDHPTHKQIQIALKNAGYYEGAINGKLGKKTRQAVKEFQKANNLTADGHVGPKTWSLLKEHLLKKEK